MIDLYGEADKPLVDDPFDGPKTGIIENAGKSILRGGLRLGSAAAMVGALPFALNSESDEEFNIKQQQSPEDRDNIVPTQEDFYRFIDDRLDPAINRLTPPPESLSTSGKIVSALFELPGQLLAGPAGIIASPALNVGRELIDQGVDPTTATVAAVGTGAVMGAAVALPAAGQTIKQTIALALANPVIGAAQDFATQQYVESRGYQDQSQMFDPFDPAARSVDLMLGVLFGGVAQYSKFRQRAPREVVDAIDAVDVKKQQQAASPFDPADAEASKAHGKAIDKAVQDMAEGKPIDVTAEVEATTPTPAEPSYTADRFRSDAQKVFGLSDEQADASVALIAARAKVQGEDLDTYIDSRLAGITDQAPEAATLYQNREIVQPFYSKLLAEVEGLNQEKWNGQQLLGKLRNTQGIKGEEVSWTGLDEFLEGEKKVTREEVQAFLRENQVEIQEITKGGEVEGFKSRLADLEKMPNGREKALALVELRREFGVAIDGSPIGLETKYHHYTLPGGENYRELLLTLPDRAGEEISALLKERADIEAPFVAKGEDLPESALPRWREINRRVTELRGQRRDGQAFSSGHYSEKNILAHIRFNERTGPNGERILHLEEVQSDWHQSGRSKGYKSDGGSVADAPFKKTWHELALRRMFRYAAEQGFERVTWTTGEQQAARYDLSQKLDALNYEKQGESYRITGQTKGDTQVNEFGTFTDGQLEDAIGKEMAIKIRDEVATGKKTGTFTGDGLKIGGEGMRGFYDKMLPKYSAKFGKKFGAKVERVEIKNPEREKMQGQVDDRLQRYHAADNATMKASWLSDAQDFERQLKALPEDIALHSLPITEPMREALLYDGQTLFQGEKGAVSFLADGRALIHALEAPDFTTLVHELAHVMEKDLSKGERVVFDQWLLSRVPGTKWTTESRETFARAFERYLTDGRAPVKELQPVFDQFKSWMLEVYKRISGTAIDVKLNDQVRNAFDRMLFTERMKTDVSPEVQQARVQQAEQGNQLINDLQYMGDQAPVPLPVDYPIPGGVPEVADVGTLVDAAPYPRVTFQAEAATAREAIDTTVQDYEHPSRLLFRAVYAQDLDRHATHLQPNAERPHRLEDGGEVVATWWSSSLDDARSIADDKTSGPTEIVAVDLNAIPDRIYLQNVTGHGDLDYIWLGIPSDISKAQLLKVDEAGSIHKGGTDGRQSLSENDLAAVETAEGQRRLSGTESGEKGRTAQHTAAPAKHLGNDGGYGARGQHGRSGEIQFPQGETSPALESFQNNPENVSRVLADLLETEATALENSHAEQMAADGHALNASVSDAPQWYLDQNRDFRKSSGSDIKKKSVVNALRRAADGQFNRLTPGQQQAVMRALDSISEQAQQYGNEIEAQKLSIGDRYTTPDLEQRIVVGERGGQLLLDNGATLDLANTLEVIGEIDSSSRTEQMPESAADYFLNEQGDIDMFTGTNSEGEPIVRSAREMIDEARAEVAKAQAQEHLYQRAAYCLGLG